MLKSRGNPGVVFALCQLLTAPLPTRISRANLDPFPEQNLWTHRRTVRARRSLPGGQLIWGVAASNSPRALATHKAHTNFSLGSIWESEAGSIRLGTSDCPQREQ
jgi:hypothetical protein